MNLSVSDLIKKAGGPNEVSDASRCTRYPIGSNAVHKWRKNGIPDVHWPIFIRKASVTAEEIYQANEMLRRMRSEEHDCSSRRKSSVAA